MFTYLLTAVLTFHELTGCVCACGGGGGGAGGGGAEEEWGGRERGGGRQSHTDSVHTHRSF